MDSHHGSHPQTGDVLIFILPAHKIWRCALNTQTFCVSTKCPAVNWCGEKFSILHHSSLLIERRFTFKLSLHKIVGAFHPLHGPFGLPVTACVLNVLKIHNLFGLYQTMAHSDGFEPPTYPLTADHSTPELRVKMPRTHHAPRTFQV